MKSEFNSLSSLVMDHGGLLRPKFYQPFLEKGLIEKNGKRLSEDTLVHRDDIIRLDGTDYRAIAGGQDRLQLAGPEKPEKEKSTGRVRVHCGLHKCLTMYQRRVYSSTIRVSEAFKPKNPFGKATRPPPFQHFYHRRDAFYGNCDRHVLSSLSGQCLALDDFADIKAVRFVRDPRDLLISGYFYHQRAAEHWCSLKGATDVDWMMVNGCVPERLPAEQTLSEYLQGASKEEGLLAEIDFRRYHFESMMAWPEDDPRVKLYRYEDTLGNEPEVFCEIFQFLDLPRITQPASRHFANRYKAGKKKANHKHIRNPRSGQWQDHFTPAVEKKFTECYGPLLERFGYEA